MYWVLFLSLLILALAVYSFYCTTQLLKEYKQKYGKDFERFLNGHK